MSTLQIPRVAEVIGPGLDKLASVRPRAAYFAQNGGRYADLFEGFGGQAALLLSYLADEVASARLRLAKGKALTELTRSEFETERTPGAIQAIGSATFSRPGPGMGLHIPGGALPKGFRLRRDAQPSAIPPVPAMTYTLMRDTPVSRDQRTVFAPMRASRAGADGNAPIFKDPSGNISLLGSLSLADTAFDTTFTITDFDAAGGSDGESDDDLVAAAEAYATGQFGPVLDAIRAGGLRGTGVHRAVVRDIAQWSNGKACAVTALCLADASWGALGATWVSAVQQLVADAFQGFGCSLICSSPYNILIRVDCDTTLRDAKYLSSTDEITVAIQEAAREYFDDRPDWYTWTLAGLRAAIARADARILTCTDATVSSVVDNSTLSEPSAKPTANEGFGLVLAHYMLAANGLNVSYAAPT